MKTIITTILSLVLTTAVFAGGPSFVVEESGSDYIMYLKIEDVSDIEAILVEGDISISGTMSQTSVSLTSADLLDGGVNYAQIEKLNDLYDYANYTVKVLNKEGYILEYPMVQVSLFDDLATN